MATARFSLGEQALFDALALPGWVDSERDPIRVFTRRNLAFPVEFAEGDSFPIYLNENQVVVWVSGTEVCIL